jgi:hypothetical protein
LEIPGENKGVTLSLIQVMWKLKGKESGLVYGFLWY